MQWMTLLREAVQSSNRTQVAAKLGISRTAVSLVLSGKYPAGTSKIETRVMEIFGRITCPFLEREITTTDCATHRNRDVPSGSPMAVRHWRACQTCQMGATVEKGDPSCN